MAAAALFCMACVLLAWALLGHRAAWVLLAAWVAFIPLTRPDGTITWVSTAWVQTVAPIKAGDGSGCTAGAKSVVILSGAMVCAKESAAEISDTLNTAEAGGDGTPDGGKK